MLELPEWNALGTEPPQSKKDTGWEVEERPPADYFNWFFNRTYECLKGILEDLMGAFNLKSAIYDDITSKINLTFSAGRAAFLQQQVTKEEDATYTISSPVANTDYYIYIRDNGSFTHNTTGAVITGAVPIWKVSTGVTLDAITTVDLRGELPGASGRAAMDAASAHFANKSNPHEVTYTQAGAAAAIHNHDNKYSQLGHGHDYSPISHNHDSRYSQLGHNHNLSYAAIDHGHDRASEAADGFARMATAAETATGTSKDKAVHPQGLKTELDKKMDIAGGQFTGQVRAQSNQAYTTRQIRNIILSPDNAVLSQMQDGDIWIKYGS